MRNGGAWVSPSRPKPGLPGERRPSQEVPTASPLQPGLKSRRRRRTHATRQTRPDARLAPASRRSDLPCGRGEAGDDVPISPRARAGKRTCRPDASLIQRAICIPGIHRSPTMLCNLPECAYKVSHSLTVPMLSLIVRFSGIRHVAKPVWTTQQIIDQLDSGYTWSGVALTYGFPATSPWTPYFEAAGFRAFSASQVAAAAHAIKLWD